MVKGAPASMGSPESHQGHDAHQADHTGHELMFRSLSTVIVAININAQTLRRVRPDEMAA